MKKPEAHSKILNNLAHLPKKIVSLEGIANTPEFVLHELCNEQCFNLKKAAFFVDNPDFNFLKGIAGFSAEEAYGHDSIWQDPQSFTDHMSKAFFNQKVKGFSHHSISRAGAADEAISRIAQDLGIAHPVSRSWTMKHDNHGFLIYEYQPQSVEGIEEHLDNSLYLLNFCPLY